ncbi:hypothetical protein ACFWGI_32360 [Streptomyces niveus]|uniref:hypothetical protein n=1 Tax=Streptomyces niveus TaxID=193462 RepID=UPI00365A776B
MPFLIDDDLRFEDEAPRPTVAADPRFRSTAPGLVTILSDAEPTVRVGRHAGVEPMEHWIEQLERRLAEEEFRRHYAGAVALNGHPLPPGRDLYALADVLGVTPGDLQVALEDELGQQEAEALLKRMGEVAFKACVTAGR